VRFEVIFLYLYDIGRSVNTAAIARELQRKTTKAGDKRAIGRRLDTPESLQLPSSLTVELGQHTLDPASPHSGGFSFVNLCARIYDEGVITVECRAELNIQLEELHTIRSRTMEIESVPTTMDMLAERHSRILKQGMAKHIKQDQFYITDQASEDYHVFCLLDRVADPKAFLEEHRDYLASFLLGENPDIRLHHSQVEGTLKTPFSFTDHDVAIFDMDRAFIIDPDQDYDDLLLIIEHANYQLLELRTLDRLLDRLLDDAEHDVRQKNSHWRGLSQKLGKLQPLRLDTLFILENLENSSRIIGDYYLEQIYGHLCATFNTQGWKRNVERRIEILQSIYTIAKTDANDRTMFLLELLVVLMIGIEIIALFLPALSH